MLRRTREVPVTFALLCAAVLGCAELPGGAGATAHGQTAQDPRRTPLVKLVELCAPSAVNLRNLVHNPKGYWDVSLGSGIIVHEDGYIWTAAHIAKGPPSEVHTYDGRVLKYRTVMRIADDMALIKVEPGKPLKAATIGRTHDLILGERVIAIGNPAGLPHTVSPGLISGLNRGRRHGANVENAIQTSAPINTGNSGGGLFNARGEVIGMIQSIIPNVENVAFAIPADHFRRMCAWRMSLGQRLGLRLGMTVSPYRVAKVTEIEPGASAAKAGVRAGDVIRRMGKMRISDGVHYHFSLLERKDGEKVPVELERGGKIIKLTVAVEKIPPRPAEKVEGLVNGLRYKAYEGLWQDLPDFDKLEPAAAGKTDKFSLAAYTGGKAQFGLKFTGYIDVPAEGNYTFFVTSDDGSKLWIGDKLIVNNDGLHAPLEKHGFIPLAKGKHPITVAFFEAGGGKALAVHYQGPKLPKKEIPASALFIKK